QGASRKASLGCQREGREFKSLHPLQFNLAGPSSLGTSPTPANAAQLEKLPYSVRQRCTVKPNLLRVPQVLHHKAKDLDYVQIRDADGKRRPIYLGKHGSAAAARRHREVLADLLAGKKVAAVRTREEQSNWPTVAALAFAFLQHAQRYYVDADGN